MSAGRRARLPVADAFAFALVLAVVVACGAPAPPSAPAASRTPLPSASANGSAPPAALAVLRVGTSGDYAPFSALARGRAVGFAPAIMESFASSAGVRLEWARFRWTEIAAGMREARWDVVADGITVTPERSIAGSFSVPIARGGAVVLVRVPAWARAFALRGGAPLEAVRRLDKKELRVVVNRGGHLEHVARTLFHDADVRAIADNVGVRDALARGEADAAMTNTFEAPLWASGLADVEAIGPLTSDVTALWVSVGRDELAERVDAWLLDEEASGRLAALRAAQLGSGGGAPTATAVSALLAATAERLALMPFVAAAKRKTGAPIEDSAQEERVLAAARTSVAAAAERARRPAPSAAAVDAFFRAEMDAAKEIQRRDASTEANYDLSRDLRPAIARITTRMAFLAARVDEETLAERVREEARQELAETGLESQTVDRIASALARLGVR